MVSCPEPCDQNINELASIGWLTGSTSGPSHLCGTTIRSKDMFDLATLGFDVRVASTSSDGLDDSWVGIRLDVDALNRLQDASVLYRFNLDGEGGEYETTVVDGPLFPAPQG